MDETLFTAFSAGASGRSFARLRLARASDEDEEDALAAGATHGPWLRRFVQTNSQRRPVPPPTSRSQLMFGGRCSVCRLAFGDLQGIRLPHGMQQASPDLRYQLRLTFFDLVFRKFFGCTWMSQPRAAATDGSSPGKSHSVSFNVPVYFNTSLCHPAIVLVLEVVCLSPQQRSDRANPNVSCGWGILRIFTGEQDPRGGKTHASSAAKQPKRLTLYHGTPRALLVPDFADPIESNKLVLPIAGAHLVYTLQPHEPLAKALHLLPENCPLPGSAIVPGLASAPANSGDALLKPRLLKSSPCFLDHITVTLPPSLERFEETLLSLLNQDRLNADDRMPDGHTVTVQERRLHIGVHNGWTFVQDPQVAVLVPEWDPGKGGAGGVHKRSASLTRTGIAGASGLTLRSQVRLPEMVNTPGFAIVFRLEYVLSAPFNYADGKTTSSTASVRSSVFMRTVRWSAWEPSAEAVDPSGGRSDPTFGRGRDVTVALLGGPRDNPAHVLVYADSAEGGCGSIRFRFGWTEEEARQLQAQRASHGPPTVTPHGHAESRHAVNPVSTPDHAGSVVRRTIVDADEASPEQLHGRTVTPVDALILAPGSGLPTSFSSTLSRAAFARLHTAASLLEIRDIHGRLADMVDPDDPVAFDLMREEADPLKGNEIVLQFVAFSRASGGGGGRRDGSVTRALTSVYFTLRFYRFAPAATRALALSEVPAHARSDEPTLLLPLGPDGVPLKGSPGLHLKYLVDPGIMKAGELRYFYDYLAMHRLHIDVWDARSLLPIGTCSVPLKHLLRCGRGAVQAWHHADVVTTDYEQLHPSGPQALSTAAVVVGQLHLRLGNIGRVADLKRRRRRMGVDAMPSAEKSASFTSGGALQRPTSDLGFSHRVATVPRLADTYPELATMLLSRAPSPLLLAEGTVVDPARARKLQRLEAVRRAEGGLASGASAFGVLSQREERARRLRDLRVVEAYRERLRPESIANALVRALTTRHALHAAPGTAEFFEFPLRNPHSTPQTVGVQSTDPELRVIVDVEEWRHFKRLTRKTTPLEEGLFDVAGGDELSPQLFLRPRETVLVPFKYQSFEAERGGDAPQGPEDPSRPWVAAMTSQQQASARRGKEIKVDVEPQPPLVNEMFRFCQPELTILKKTIRLPAWHSFSGRAEGRAEQQLHVRCSDANILCNTSNSGASEPCDISVKVSGSPSPHVTTFFIMIYTDPYHAVPVQLWRMLVHWVQRVDVSCQLGQSARTSLPLRGTRALRRVQCHVAQPDAVVEVSPRDEFTLQPDSVHEVSLRVRPLSAGTRSHLLSAVDTESLAMLNCWLVCVSCSPPVISREFEFRLPADGVKGSSKRIKYTNPYGEARKLELQASRPDLVVFKEDIFEVAARGEYSIGLRFVLGAARGTESILIFINNAEGDNEETLCVRVTYD
ncbi:nephrocystin-4 isoform X2 [Lampetra fluviatilis]